MLVGVQGAKPGQNACEAFRRATGLGWLLHSSAVEALGVLVLGISAAGVAFWFRLRRPPFRVPSRTSSPKNL